MAIRGIVGLQGHGKTYCMVEYARRTIERGRVQVFANFTIEGATTFGAADLLDLPPGVVLIDEAHWWLSARQSMRLPQSWWQKFSSARKSGWYLIWSAQHESRVDKILRDNSDYIDVSRCVLRLGPKSVDISTGEEVRGPTLFRRTRWTPESIRKAHTKPVATKLVRFKQSVADMYDTREVIDDADHLADVKDVYRQLQEMRPRP